MPLLTETRGRVRLLTLNRPEKRNALNNALVGAIVESLRAADADPDVAAVVIAAAGPGFSAGADLGERAILIADPEARVARAALSDAMLAAPGLMGKPVVAAIHGATVGAGASLALSCDLVLGAEDLRFAWPEARHDIYPALVLPMLLRHLGPKDAFELVATGRPVLAAEALARRLVNRVVPREALLEEACALAGQAAQYGAESLRRIKAAINASGVAP
ncbi:enoyl-CoA hydratase/isomerase family protein [Paeniroseomonas aquatica]|uniref:Enoyl-CoA hydratase/isomerase family protein n=1 Tax=Paeniroseomonas aquatica TaxID=373043 RepID=A0ABT8A0D9_9PROT|nr:enoyl-CoA hydratase/isomerase family protein [Paeniroseomonas aquatica]MDN3563200.1 enoyl-CoA hydratase/isomerase family protein [Paeniroseomonas aquatica]